MRPFISLLPYLPFIILALAAMVAILHIAIYW